MDQDIFQTLILLTTLELPYFLARVVFTVKFNVSSTTMVFYTTKNVIMIIFLVYRLWVKFISSSSPSGSSSTNEDDDEEDGSRDLMNMKLWSFYSDIVSILYQWFVNNQHNARPRSYWKKVYETFWFYCDFFTFFATFFTFFCDFLTFLWLFFQKCMRFFQVIYKAKQFCLIVTGNEEEMHLHQSFRILNPNLHTCLL